MLNRLFNVGKLGPFARGVSAKPAALGSTTQPEAACCQVLKIVHVGGHVESYYMAMPAVKIIEKYPSSILARPEIFRRPWDSVVRKEEILNLGEKFLVVPRRTVKKLQRTIKKPDREVSVKNSFVSKSVVSCKRGDFSFQQNEVSVSSEVSPCSSFKSAFRKKSSVRKQVRFVGIEVKHKEVKPRKPEKSLKSRCLGGKRGARSASATWQPSLIAITEKTDE
ncbi:hypothetical protein Ddye_015363 [Dipteronia dyeriana]|uniref:Uncharacterized protein n=1 Tax=Dipteronia dyeriana TaxID=168575 RepID=A0AAD9U5A6_9ROSI|nr:hypothetical protein Ddye_015363 [Dipteronia dyeriana]